MLRYVFKLSLPLPYGTVAGPMFNLPNTLNPNNPASTSINSTLYGKINTDVAGSASFIPHHPVGR